MIETISNKR